MYSFIRSSNISILYISLPFLVFFVVVLVVVFGYGLSSLALFFFSLPFLFPVSKFFFSGGGMIQYHVHDLSPTFLVLTLVTTVSGSHSPIELSISCSSSSVSSLLDTAAIETIFYYFCSTNNELK